MRLLDRYLLRQIGLAFLACLVVLTGLIWVTQALRDFDLVTAQGQTAAIFLVITTLAIPSLVVIIAPIALFIAAVWALNRLNNDSELVVMNAAGVSGSSLARPLALLAILVAAVVGTITLYAQPASMRELRFWLTQVRADLIAKIVREGQFTTVDKGITFHIRERGNNGTLLGIFVQDARNPAQVLTYIAERGQIAETDKGTFLVLEKGSVQRQEREVPQAAGAAAGTKPAAKNAPAADPGTPALSSSAPAGASAQSAEAEPELSRRSSGDNSAIVVFERYAFDLSQLIEEPDVMHYKPRERYTSELWHPDPNDPDVKSARGRLRAELVSRLVAPLYALAFMAVAFATMGQARTTRQSRGTALGVGILAVLAVRILGFAAETSSARSAVMPYLAIAVPLLATLAALAVALQWWRPRTPGRRVSAVAAG